MKLTRFFIIILSIITFGLQSYVKDDCTGEVTFLQTTPVYMPEAEIRQDITAKAQQTLFCECL